MTNETDRIECAIRHIQTAVDVDPWAAEIAVDAMQKQIPWRPMKSVDAFNKNLYKLYCPTCGTCIAYENSRIGTLSKIAAHTVCGCCGQRIDWTEGEG